MLRVLARVDVARLQQQVDETLLPIYVDLRAQEPAQPGPLPEPIPEPELSEGPHLNYAGQWFIFALLTIIVYPLLLRRVARRRQEGRARSSSSEIVDLGAGPAAPEGDGGPPPVTVPPSS